MPLPPIVHQLSNFEQIEILRNEIEQFEEELKKTESRIRDVLYQIEKQRFLQTVHPVFKHSPIVAESEALPEMNETRETLAGALDSMRAALAELEGISGPVPQRPPQRPNAPPLQRPPSMQAPAAAPAANPGIRKNRFDAF